MKSEKPLVSIIVRTKDRPVLLQDALKSIANQNYTPLEVVVVNDGGCNINDVVSQFKQDGISVKLLTQKQNVGRSAAGNIGLRASTGNHLIFLDDDDWFESQHISALVKALTENCEYLAAYTGVRYCESPEQSNIHVLNEPYDPVHLMLENTIPLHALMFDRSLLEYGCKLDEAFNQFEDWDLWLQFSCYTGFFHVDQISAGYRAGGDSSAGWGDEESGMVESRRKLVKKWKVLWDEEKLDKALRWAKKIRFKEFKDLSVQHSDLISEHQKLEHLHGDLISEHQKLEGLHSDLLSDHQKLEGLHSDLIFHHQKLEGLHSDLLSDHQRLAHLHTNLTADYHILKKTNDDLTAVNQQYAREKDSLLNDLHLLREDNAEAGRRHQTLEEQFNIVHTAYTDILNSKCWRYTLYPRILGSKLKRSKSFMWFYGKVQSFVLMCRHIFERGCDAGLEKSAQQQEIPEYRIGVAAHIFYTDLFEELCSYLNNIPYAYHLFLSVTSDSDRDIIYQKLDCVNNQARVNIKVVPNRGRDIAPVLVDFREDLRSMDIIAHIHTKKSDYTGSVQFGSRWRDYLLNSLLGSKECVCSILDYFSAHPKVGIVYPETFSGLPYWAHTWLSNRSHGERILGNLGFAKVDFSQYIDYPAGSMFWARSEALFPLFDLQLSTNDFPAETGQTDNTLHHAVERCFVFSARAAGFQHHFIADSRVDTPCTQIEFNPGSSFVIDQYTVTSFADKVKEGMQQAEVISFDIFDTLIIRPFAEPDAVFLMLAEQVEKQFGVNDFFSRRKTAETLLRRDLPEGQDISISQIYEKLGAVYQIDKELTCSLLRLEIQTEQRLIKPRTAVVDMVKSIKAAGKRVILISDMYLEASDIHGFLKNTGIDVFDALYLSSTEGLRKDNGTMWPYVLEKEQVSREKILHIGDNEQSDIQMPVDRKFINPVHILKPVALLDNIKGGRLIISIFRNNKTWYNELMLGLIANRVSECLDREPGNHGSVFQNPWLFGYAVTGPIIFSFMAWLIKHAHEKKHSALFFLSREGWVLNALYHEIIEHPCVRESDLNLPEGRYLYCSRTFIGLAAIEKPDDLNILLSSHYKGTVKKLLTGKFGITDLAPFLDILGEQELAREIELPGDYEIVMDHLTACIDVLAKLAAKAKEKFRRYWLTQTHGIKKAPVIIDIGYSGTIQKAMMKVLDLPLTGYYFVTNATAEGTLENGGQCQAHYGNFIPLERLNDLTIHRYSLLLEAVMTSPEGQMNGLKNDLTPTFKSKGKSQHQFDVIEKIHKGIIDFSRDILDVTGPDFINISWEKDHLPELVSLVVHRQIDIGSLKSFLFVEDEFSGNGELAVLDFYKTAGGASSMSEQ